MQSSLARGWARTGGAAITQNTCWALLRHRALGAPSSPPLSSPSACKRPAQALACVLHAPELIRVPDLSFEHAGGSVLPAEQHA